MRENLFFDLEKEITITLLFLKSVQRIRIEELNQTHGLLLRCEANRTVEANSTLIVQSVGGKREETRFLVHSMDVSNLDDGEQKEELKELSTQLKVLTRVSVACCLSSNDDLLHERVSVMLPLPANPSTKSGLPVAVNAFFALGDSR